MEGTMFTSIDDETTTHAFLLYLEVVPTWFAFLMVQISPSNIVSFSTWLHSILLMSDNSSAGHVFELLQAIWDHRNDWVFRGKLLSVSQILNKVISMVTPEKPNTGMQIDSSPNLLVDDAFHVFVNASWCKDKVVGVGFIAMDKNQVFMAAG
ncbi:hypothetical protein RIF29_14250 [Crotalaria pallida]|uniref:Uncharacterized protein n=1 Tax=Crotalaria pallida TaxID=3830 RepID=A0AAN9FDI3_CROPI